MRLLLNAQADTERDGWIGKTALMRASENGHSQVAQLLVEARASIDRSFHGTALHMASENGHVQVVQLLVQARAGIDEYQSSRVAALTKASVNGRVQIVQLLLEARANIDLGEWEWQPLTKASRNGHLQVVRLLVEARANLEPGRLSTERTPLMMHPGTATSRLRDFLRKPVLRQSIVEVPRLRQR